MVTLVKHEWHQVDEQYAIEIDESLLSEIYPDYDEAEISTLIKQIEDGEIDIDEVMNEAWNNDIEIEWDHQYSDCWTSRKGGYEVTYELGDASSWHHTPTPPEPTHKCTKCKWTGQGYEADWHWPENDDADEKEAKKVCPYCESDTELTEAGIENEKKKEEARIRCEEMYKDDNIDIEDQ